MKRAVIINQYGEEVAWLEPMKEEWYEDCYKVPADFFPAFLCEGDRWEVIVKED